MVQVQCSANLGLSGLGPILNWACLYTGVWARATYSSIRFKFVGGSSLLFEEQSVD
jgi:hypothetical protein